MSAVADGDFLPRVVKKYRPSELGKNVESQQETCNYNFPEMGLDALFLSG